MIGEDVDFEDGKLTLEFEGNRVDLISVSPGRGAYDVLVDGIPPSQHPECWAFTRPTPLVAPDAWTNLFKIDSNTLLQAEDWTLEILEVDEKGENVKFKLAGCVTGSEV